MQHKIIFDAVEHLNQAKTLQIELNLRK